MKQNIPLELVPIEDDGFHIRIKAEINGKAASLLIDTGMSPPEPYLTVQVLSSSFLM